MTIEELQKKKEEIFSVTRLREERSKVESYFQECIEALLEAVRMDSREAIIKGREIKKVLNRMVEAINSDGSVESILKEFLTISDDTLRKQCLMIAMEGALANGEVNQEEENFLDNFRQMLNIDTQWAEQMSNIITIRCQ